MGLIDRIYALPGAGMAHGEENIDFLPREMQCFILQDNEQRILVLFCATPCKLLFVVNDVIFCDHVTCSPHNFISFNNA